MCSTCGWQEVRDYLISLRDKSGDEHEWAFDAIFDLLRSLDENEHVTDEQKRAIADIRLGPLHGPRW